VDAMTTRAAFPVPAVVFLVPAVAFPVPAVAFPVPAVVDAPSKRGGVASASKLDVLDSLRALSPTRTILLFGPA